MPPPFPSQFGKYLVEKQRPAWAEQYVGERHMPSRAPSKAPRRHRMVAPTPPSPLRPSPPCMAPPAPQFSNRHLAPPPSADYKALKDLIKASAVEEATAGVQSFSPRTTSLTVQRSADRRDSGASHGWGAVVRCGLLCCAHRVGPDRQGLLPRTSSLPFAKPCILPRLVPSLPAL